ncbi:sterol-binding protein KNAG_0C01610 [Huiozyma naganishii CBS 8797]|uniref:SCP domain-containing protein n=1 Tax=Huiozyma naganishii (strain ATCC MYA-139 / BCRC 22969 / CBS 8797 / KCTC 17520 / NBRC 10181 / NCYC 3082 / Yp74L-3) TaxID=1071383 RepID=J7S4F8_HUIN7|nr:hypothetical protein KNAG_0C01610 [Kazachstania naganishii CBS 8797]CCK69274.1 hypothetical protein KNAG_0C01610 [Kazachstania naganishii CBS 8797]
MKFSTVALLSAVTAGALAAPAAVTVTEHVHNQATVMVKGVVYVTDGQTMTTFATVVADDNTAATPAPTATPAVKQALNDADFESPTTVAATDAATPTTEDATTIAPATTTVAQQAATTTQSSNSGLSDFANELLNEHNAKRALHQNTPSLTWSDELASYAQNYANSYDCSGNLVHSGGPYGENLSQGYGIAGAVDAWYDEISQYNYGNPGFSENTGHFTQVVWKSTTQVGCASKSCGSYWGDYVICSYQSAGNFGGQYADNVQPLA